MALKLLTVSSRVTVKPTSYSSMARLILVGSVLTASKVRTVKLPPANGALPNLNLTRRWIHSV
eukprot:CAMPEP_0114978506 /NCGR_PEP_ID=MMETSP0216-20121206/3846_1 /TAXON_ID=223996 /ORGANISM="Protocruzia adherens, Strain Boccale" /LENGTH=62 /DNA_ID=CAMNT_0002339713 /DNA_START=206 /DNA_END=390 /DNA_ORIENTATION=-